MTKWLVAFAICAIAVTAGCATNSKATTKPSAGGDPLTTRAMAIQREVPLIDGHNDLPWQLRQKAGSDLFKMNPRGPLPELHTDIPRLKAGGVGGVFFAAYTPYTMAERGIAARFTFEQIDLIHRMIDFSPELEFATKADDIERIHRQGKIAAMIGIEGGHAIENSLALLRQYYAIGVRYMTLTHTDTIDWADAAGSDATHGGLTPFGEEVVREMNRLGMLVDLSHVSDETMRHALRVTDAPVVFSHSSARALAPEQLRDVPDDVLTLVHAKGGVVMVNFFSGFLLPEPAGREKVMDARKRIWATTQDEDARRAAMREWFKANPMPHGNVGTIADHIDHIVKVAGIDHVGIGSDYDGVNVLPDGMDDVSCYPKLTVELLRRGYSDGDVKKVLGLNLLRVMREAEAVSKRLRTERPPSIATTQPVNLIRDLPTSRPAGARRRR